MKYNFDEIVERRGTGSYKWDVDKGELPMWVADMDFKTAPDIIEALKVRAEHGIYGYSVITDDWYDAISSWWMRRHNYRFEKEWMIFCTGVIPAISSVVRKLTTPAEKVLIQSPVYNIFYNSILNNGRVVVENRLIVEEGVYRMDFEDLEEKLSDPQVTLMILCNPHNPVGVIWDKETLSRVGELCSKYNVTVLSDEIHCDITEPGYGYIPFASVSETCRDISITCVAATKCFNMAGLQSAVAIVPDAFLRHKVWRGLNTDEVAEPNAFAITAVTTAFNKGEEWLEELKIYLWENRRYAEQVICDRLPGVYPVKAQATYLLWLDCRGITTDSAALAEYIREETGLYICEGEEYGSGGDGFLRINLACPRQRVADGIDRLCEGIKKYMMHITKKTMFMVE